MKTLLALMTIPTLEFVQLTLLNVLPLELGQFWGFVHFWQNNCFCDFIE